MIEYEVQINAQVVADPEDTRQVAEFAAAVQRHLVEHLQVPTEIQPADDSGAYAFWMTVQASSPIEAAVDASGLLRTAAHASGVRTPDWPQEQTVVTSDWRSRLVERSVEAHEAREGLLVGD